MQSLSVQAPLRLPHPQNHRCKQVMLPEPRLGMLRKRRHTFSNTRNEGLLNIIIKQIVKGCNYTLNPQCHTIHIIAYLFVLILY